MIRLRPALFFAALLCSAPSWAGPAVLKSVGVVGRGGSPRLVLDFASGRADAEIVRSPKQLLLRLKNTRLLGTLGQASARDPLLGKLSAVGTADALQLTVALKEAATVRSRVENGGARLTLELQPAVPAAKAQSRNEPQAVRTGHGGDRTRSTPAGQTAPGHAVVIAIDAGHGGKDTGAIGPAGTQEKDVVFGIAHRLEALIRAEPGMRPLMVRRGDHFIDLRQRAEIARRARADLFVSIHADAYINAEAKGSSVFTLSSHGASNVAARWLADRANAADLVGGVKLRDKGKLLASVLLDLSQGATQESSDRAALRILGELDKNHQLHHRDVQKAGFVVLMSPDMPSLLVETAFISNPHEEQSLRSAQHQEQLARAIFAGIRRHFGGRVPAAPKAGASVLLAAQP